MKTFKCSCKDRQIIFFENSHCLACNRVVGLDDNFDQVEAYNLDEDSGEYFKAAQPKIRYLRCDNHAEFNACNGMIKLSTDASIDDNDKTLPNYHLS